MSTFSGIISEFPDVRIDYFHSISGAPKPLAYFLSHVHSDHCKGLENYLSPAFIYCSGATRELLLRLERYGNRKNFDDGILEAKQLHFKHLRSVLRPLPLNTPTKIQLTPQRSIRVTLFDANHCPGAVMFLIEDDSKSVLYTGDIRAEAWWREAIFRNPVMIPYSCGLRTLNKVYLDTTHADRAKENWDFPSKASGMRHLVAQVAQYPEDTIFHINTWTLGYEDALSCLAAAFSTKIHVDRYKADLYAALSKSTSDAHHWASDYLNGFDTGTKRHMGFLTTEEKTRFHTCHPYCESLLTNDFVRIIPVIDKGLYEVGAQPRLRDKDSLGKPEMRHDGVTFAFARHSCYRELCELIRVLRPDEVYPCVVDECWDPSMTMSALFGSICQAKQFHFDLEMLRAYEEAKRNGGDEGDSTQASCQSHAETLRPDSVPSSPLKPAGEAKQDTRSLDQVEEPHGSLTDSQQAKRLREDGDDTRSISSKRNALSPSDPSTQGHVAESEDLDSQITIDDTDFGSQSSLLSNKSNIVDRYKHRKRAYEAARSGNPEDWVLLSMLSSSGQHESEQELG